MSSDSGPAGPEPFTLSFDSYEACYYPELDEVLDVLSERVRSLLGDVSGLDQGDLYALLERLDADLSDEECDSVNEALDQIRPHSDCTCASDRWLDEESYFDEMLASLPDTTWAVDRFGEVFDDLHAPFSVSELFSRVRSRDGWDAVELVWDSEALRASFSGYGMGSTQLRLRPLDREELALASSWEDCDGYVTDVATRVLDTPRDVLELGFELVETGDSVGVLLDLTQVVDVLTAEGRSPLTPEQREIALGLLDGWEGSAAALLDTACAVLPAEAA